MNNYDDIREEYKRRINSGNKNVFIFPFVAIILIFMGLFLLNKTDGFIKNASTTTAKIYTERNTYEVNENHPNYYRSYAEYYVNGVRYYEPINTSKTKFSIGPFSYTNTRNGEEIIIYYNPNNPKEIMEKSTNIFGYFFIGFGILIIIVLVVHLITNVLTNVGSISNENIQNKVLDALNDKTLNKIENVQNVINISLNTVFKIMLIIIGVLIILFGIFSLNIDSSFSKNYKETIAVVTKINQTEERDIHNKKYIKTHVFVRYKIENQIYNSELDKASGYNMNDNITIYYNPDNPNEIRASKEMDYSGIIIIIVGISIIIIGFLKNEKLAIKTL